MGQLVMPQFGDEHGARHLWRFTVEKQIVVGAGCDFK